MENFLFSNLTRYQNEIFTMSSRLKLASTVLCAIDALEFIFKCIKSIQSRRCFFQTGYLGLDVEVKTNPLYRNR